MPGFGPLSFVKKGPAFTWSTAIPGSPMASRIGVFMMQNGPGAENGFGGVAQAYAESVPILLLPAGMARQRRGVHPNFYPTRSYEPITKWCAEINLVERVPELMRRAFAKLRSGRPGPVLLEIPQDVATQEFRAEWLDYTPPPRLRQAGDPEASNAGGAGVAGGAATDHPCRTRGALRRSYRGTGADRRVLTGASHDDSAREKCLSRTPSPGGRGQRPQHHTGSTPLLDARGSGVWRGL